MVANMPTWRLTKKLADMELDKVTNMEVNKVADMFKSKCIKHEIF